MKYIYQLKYCLCDDGWYGRTCNKEIQCPVKCLNGGRCKMKAIGIDSVGKDNKKPVKFNIKIILLINFNE